jgi:hypothetical protein
MTLLPVDEDPMMTDATIPRKSGVSRVRGVARGVARGVG